MDGKERIKEVGKTDSPGLCCHSKYFRIAKETPGTPFCLDIKLRFIIPV
jgi:hypothetical protein